MNRKATLLALALIAFGLILGTLLLRSSKPAPPPLPNPNGYDDFLKARPLISSSSVSSRHVSLEELRTAVTNDAAAVQLVRAGLQKGCQVPIEYSLAYATNHMVELGLFKQLVRAFANEGKLAELEERPRDAALAYVDAIRFGHECSRGGLIIDMLVGVACQSLGTQPLQDLLDELSAADCRVVLTQLQDIDAKTESAEQVLERERIWGRRTFGWQGRLAGLVMRRSLKANAQKAAGKMHAQHRAERSLQIQGAARVYLLEKGSPPGSVADLVPTYLPAAPVDPANGAPLPLSSPAAFPRHE